MKQFAAFYIAWCFAWWFSLHRCFSLFFNLPSMLLILHSTPSLTRFQHYLTMPLCVHLAAPIICPGNEVPGTAKAAASSTHQHTSSIFQHVDTGNRCHGFQGPFRAGARTKQFLRKCQGWSCRLAKRNVRGQGNICNHWTNMAAYRDHEQLDWRPCFLGPLGSSAFSWSIQISWS